MVELHQMLLLGSKNQIHSNVLCHAIYSVVLKDFRDLSESFFLIRLEGSNHKRTQGALLGFHLFACSVALIDSAAG